jgi:hypothetical protein
MELFDFSQKIKNGIEGALASKKGFLVGRNGTIEMEVLLTRHNGMQLEPRHAMQLERNAGIFPTTPASIANWIRKTLVAVQDSDLLVAGWYKPIASHELEFLRDIGKRGPYLPLRALEPYYVPEAYQWTSTLEGRRVAVVSSFAETACQQASRSDAVWSGRAVLPKATYLPVQTRYSPRLAKGHAEWPDTVKSWEAAVADVVNRVMEQNAEIVLIGCGGLGMVIGHELRIRGKVCIVMGGAIQVLFGIKGQRWQNHSIISSFWNDAWVWPRIEDTPGGADEVEGGCYWRATV